MITILYQPIFFTLKLCNTIPILETTFENYATFYPLLNAFALLPHERNISLLENLTAEEVVYNELYLLKKWSMQKQKTLGEFTITSFLTQEAVTFSQKLSLEPPQKTLSTSSLVDIKETNHSTNLHI